MISVERRRVGRARFDVHVRHPQERVVAPGAAERAAAAEVLASMKCAVSRLVWRPTRMPSLTSGHLRRLHAVVVEADGAKPAAGLVGGDVEELRAVLELADVRELHEARARRSWPRSRRRDRARSRARRSRGSSASRATARGSGRGCPLEPSGLAVHISHRVGARPVRPPSRKSDSSAISQPPVPADARIVARARDVADASRSR